MHFHFHLQAVLVVSPLLISHKISQYKVLFLTEYNHSSFLIALPFIRIAQEAVHIPMLFMWCFFNSAKTTSAVPKN